MKCAKCGAEIRTGCIYCSNCGEEAQIVTEINVLEDDLLRAMIEEQEAKKRQEQQTADEEKKKAEELRKRKQKEKQKLKKTRQKLLVLIVILAVLCLAGVGYMKYHQNHSVDYLMEKAATAYNRKEYQDALDYLERTLSLEKENQDALLMQGKIYALMKDDEQAKEVLTKVIELDASCADAYECLLELYEKDGAYDKIVELKESVTDQDILSLFAGYVVEPPSIDKESGSYSEYFEVKLSSRDKNAEIYYTLDGSTPTKEDTRYEDAIEISEQGETILTAVCMDENGNYSDAAVAEYEIELEAPAVPQVSPDGGQFTTPVTISVTVPEGTSVYYTWDGGIPAEGSQKYTGPIDVPEGNNILSLIAIDEYGMKSDVLKCNYIYYPE